MFAIIAATAFSAAFLLAIGTIAWMFALYHEKMTAALLFKPMPLAAPVYNLRISRTRVSRPALDRAATSLSSAILAA
jgi:hypothetical protein